MYVYWWHVGGLRAVKVGHADDPRQRVSDYRSDFRLGGKDVRGYKLDRGTDAAWVESQLCRLLETKGLRRIALRVGDEEEEFFALGGRTFEDADEILSDATRHIALAEFSNQRKRQMRQELQVAQVSTPPQQEQTPPEQEQTLPPQDQETNQAFEELRPDEQHPSAASAFPATARRWLHLVGAIVVCGLVMGLGGDDVAPGSGSASLTEQKNPPITTALQDGESSAGPRRDNSCALVEFSDTLIHVSCAGSWASMRWDGRWVFDSGHAESAALDFFNASDVARRVVALPPREPVPQLPERVEVKPERLPQSNQPAAPAASSPQPQQLQPPQPQPPEPQPPQPQPPQATPRPAAAQPQPPPPQETPLPRQRCTVSRPKPGFKVYLVTCPNSPAMIGRTVNSATGWTVGESVNAAEAIEFFMKSPYAR